MKTLAMVDDDGARPSRSVLVSAKVVDSRVRLVIDRVKNDGEHGWIAECPVTFKDFDRASFDTMSDEDLRTLGEMLIAELGAQLDHKSS